MSILAWLGLTPPPDNVTAATHDWLATDRDARAEQSAREQLTSWQCRDAAARLELRERNRMYGRASATIGAQRDTIARLRGERDDWRTSHEDQAREIVTLHARAFGQPGDEQRAADEALDAAMQRHPSGQAVADPADTAKIGDPDLDWRDDDATCCKAVRDSRWACTRSEGHRGQHVAGGGKVHAVWPNADADAALVATAERLGDEIGPGRTAAIEGAAITLRAHPPKVLDSWGSDRCSCGWTGADHSHHVAEQLAVVGALGTFPPAATPPDLIDGGDDRWRWVPAGYSLAVDRPRTRDEVDINWGPIREVEPEEVPF